MKDLLIKLNACHEACEWADDKTWEEVYNTCERGDWLLWLFVKTNPKDLELITLAKGHIANTVRHLMKDERSTKAIDMAIAFGEGKATKKELNAASADAAYAYAYAYTAAASAATTTYADAAADASNTAAAYAANTAAAYSSSASAADASADAAAYATTYASADASASADATVSAARKYSLNKSADIVRKYIPIEFWNINNN